MSGAAEGYNPNRDPQYNNRRFGPQKRFEIQHVVESGRDVLVKTGKAPELYENLDRELLWGEFMQAVEAGFPEAGLASPKIYGVTDGERPEIRMEYIDAPFLAEEYQLGRLDDEQFLRFVGTFEIFDRVGGNWRSKSPRDDSNDHTPYNQVDKSWDEWNKYTKFGLVSPKMQQDARHLVAEYQHFVKPQMQHGDYKPWHIFNKNGEWIVFDGEHCGEKKPRFYDLAYMYARTFVLAKDPATAKRLLSEFVTIHDEDSQDFFNAFLPVLMSRSMGMFLDTFIARIRLEFGHKPCADELYNLCVKRDLDVLL